MDAALLAPVTAWVEAYVKAWGSNDPADIRALFTPDAAYLCEPYAEAWRGADEIVRGWLGRRDEPGQFSFSWRPLSVTPEVAIVQGEVAYPAEGNTYANLWVLRLDADGRCREFTEWWMRHP